MNLPHPCTIRKSSPLGNLINLHPYLTIIVSNNSRQERTALRKSNTTLRKIYSILHTSNIALRKTYSALHRSNTVLHLGPIVLHKTNTVLHLGLIVLHKTSTILHPALIVPHITFIPSRPVPTIRRFMPSPLRLCNSITLPDHRLARHHPHSSHGIPLANHLQGLPHR